MLAVPQPSPAESRENQTFEALLWALSRPGLVRAMPGLGDADLLAALVDRECLVHAADPLLIPAVLKTGAKVAELTDADHVFAGTLGDLAVLDQLQMGSDLYPDDGATLVVHADLKTGPMLRLTGPGVDGTLDVHIGGLPDGFWQRRAQIMRYPAGFELFLLDDDQVMGIPRSTQVEVL
ncbi:phosphonate metabolism protein PhnH [Actibacterium mucosum KCTC 23349]|uniref:Phosphonate metabolism protein PhnH n=1 Tax=Actibacterium mucosum KCTC 23349 TaxID=1454373 RepID=A0A037ZHI6_9RHOB|nr:phosphonate C-P lyase system protein PhnH [Actibacterium mucosum]KAJ54270.1 phosphonate metabolism protein PhnH [Actibacterium mucosum KCTC 23349]